MSIRSGGLGRLCGQTTEGVWGRLFSSHPGRGAPRCRRRCLRSLRPALRIAATGGPYGAGVGGGGGGGMPAPRFAGGRSVGRERGGEWPRFSGDRGPEREGHRQRGLGSVSGE